MPCRDLPPCASRSCHALAGLTSCLRLFACWSVQGLHEAFLQDVQAADRTTRHPSDGQYDRGAVRGTVAGRPCERCTPYDSAVLGPHFPTPAGEAVHESARNLHGLGGWPALQNVLFDRVARAARVTVKKIRRRMGSGREIRRGAGAYRRHSTHEAFLSRMHAPGISSRQQAVQHGQLVPPALAFTSAQRGSGSKCLKLLT